MEISEDFMSDLDKEIISLKDKLLAAEQRLAAMRGVVQRLEWEDVRNAERTMFKLCPVCGNTEHQGHKSNCQLSAALAADPPPAAPDRAGTKNHNISLAAEYEEQANQLRLAHDRLKYEVHWPVLEYILNVEHWLRQQSTHVANLGKKD